jgi:hypothetical protein
MVSIKKRPSNPVNPAAVNTQDILTELDYSSEERDHLLKTAAQQA